MKFVTVIDAHDEAEALMYIEMLNVKGIKAIKSLPSNQQFLRAYNGGASLPFDMWEVKVREADVETAQALLPVPEKVEMRIADTPRSVKTFSMLVLSSIVLGLVFSFIEMIKYFFR